MLIRTLAWLRPGDDLSRPLAATRASLRRLARRHQTLDAEIAELDAEIGPLARQAAPALLELFGVGPETTGQLLASAGDNKEGLNKKDITRCLKRFVAREVYRALTGTPTGRIKPTWLHRLDSHRSIFGSSG